MAKEQWRPPSAPKLKKKVDPVLAFILTPVAIALLCLIITGIVGALSTAKYLP